MWRLGGLCVVSILRALEPQGIPAPIFSNILNILKGARPPLKRETALNFATTTRENDDQKQ